MNEQTDVIQQVELPPAPPRSKSEMERDAFLRLLPALLATHRGRYVAIHEEKVVGEGTNPAELAVRVWKQVGRVAIHVDLVTDEPPRPIRIPIYREVRPG